MEYAVPHTPEPVQIVPLPQATAQKVFPCASSTQQVLALTQVWAPLQPW